MFVKPEIEPDILKDEAPLASVLFVTT